MDIDKKTGLVAQAEFIPSPNHDDRPPDTPIDLLVVHNISLPPGQFGGPYITQLFCNKLNPDEHSYFKGIAHLHVSAHFLIRRDGHLIQFVPTTKRAWHAGVSEFCGREKCNDFSIGIEMEGSDDQVFEEAQYHTLARLVRLLTSAYPAIKADNITGHSDIAPGRKTDPGPYFDWERFKTDLA
ncbi:MAG: 1,6-anhydro-N-acetylmuramyl-L-alanine amidase AmpD [Gammaproteobacteria bacterium]|nr:1,6-anhydro-N-acetylmuramyl-L-alanine amidase AmpD [Gammaproteobacteria bacterium]